MHTPDKPQRITRSAQRVGHSVRRKLADRYEHGHRILLFIFQTTVPQVPRHADDFEIALLLRERDAPAHRILVLEVRPRQPLADHCNRPGARLIAKWREGADRVRQLQAWSFARMRSCETSSPQSWSRTGLGS